MNDRISSKENNPFSNPPNLSTLLENTKNDPTAKSLLLVNILAIALAVIASWDVQTVMMLYWGQSVIIGIFQVFRILDIDLSLYGKHPELLKMLRENKPQNPIEPEMKLINGKWKMKVVSTSRGGKQSIKYLNPRILNWFMALFFTIHYGGFHYGYTSFLTAGGIFSGSSKDTDHTDFLLLALGLFFLNHLYSYLKNRETERKTPKDIRKIFFMPYVRIVPMHLAVMMSGFVFMVFPFLAEGVPNAILLVFFLSLKTYADLATHFMEHDHSGSK